MQTILGSGGAIGTELARVLPKYTNKIRLVSRNPEKVNDTDDLFRADLTKQDEVISAVKNSEVVYLTVGLPYNTKVWQTTWPVIMKNVIEACKANRSKLVFFDNIYMYDGSNLNPITEEHAINPSSKKGKVRMEIARMLLNAVNKGEIEALIARSADFYGPSVKNVSMLTETVLNPLSKAKKAQWIGSIKFKHSFTYTHDAAKATALLGNTPDAFGEVWHLPTAPNPYTAKQFIEIIAGMFGVKPKYQVANKFMLRIIGLFVPIMREMIEMAYQYDRDYVFSSEKFENKFGFEPTSYSEGIREILKKDYGL